MTRRFTITPANSGTELKRMVTDTIKASFMSVKGETVNHHFDVNPYAAPYPCPFRGYKVGTVTEDGRKWELYIEPTPSSSMIVFGATPLSLRIKEVNR